MTYKEIVNNMELILGVISVTLGLVSIYIAWQINKKSEKLLKGISDLLTVGAFEIATTKIDEELTDEDKHKIKLAYDSIDKPKTDKEYFLKGFYLWRIKKQAEDAIFLFNKSIRLNSKYSEAFYYLGRVYEYKQNPDYNRAIEYLEKAIELEPNYSNAYYDLGAVYEVGYKEYAKAIEIKPNYAFAYNSMGIAYVDGYKEYDKAIDCYKRAIEIKPNYADAYYNLGYDLSDKNNPNPNYDKAIEYLEKAIEFNPNYEKAYYILGNAYQYGKTDYDNAIKCYMKFITTYNNNAKIFKKVYLEEEMPNLPEVYYKMGNAYQYGKQDNNKAIEYYNEAIKLKPDYATAHYRIGLTYGINGNKIKAEEHIHRAAEYGYEKAKQWLKNNIYKNNSTN